MVLIYCYAIFDAGDFDRIGKRVEAGTGIDSSICDAVEGSLQLAEEKRKKRLAKSKRKLQSDDASLATVLEMSAKTESQIRALEVLCKHGNKKQKRAAILQLALLSGINDQSDDNVSSSDESSEDESS